MYYDYIQISKINDFLFCPHSLYFHSVYEDFDSVNYKARPQVAGKLIHKTIDQRGYSDRKNILQGMEIFSEKYEIIGKIDIYNAKNRELIERKKKIRKIYEGYLFQLYAQKICLEEMGYKVEKLSLYSFDDNKKYNVKFSKEEFKRFKKIIKRIKSFDPLLSIKQANQKKCNNCIYKELCRK
jgi:CRISPR-associated exonuclease Cas4